MSNILKSALRTGLSIMALAGALAVATAPADAETRFKISIDSGPTHINNITLRTFLDNLKEATGGELLDPSVALLAPGGSHLRLVDGRKAQLSDAPAIGALRPRADLTIQDVAEAHGERTLLVVLTGMGRDGLDAARVVKKRGGRILVEAESSCTVYGMPRAIAEAGLADQVLDLRDLPAAIIQEAGA